MYYIYCLNLMLNEPKIVDFIDVSVANTCIFSPFTVNVRSYVHTEVQRSEFFPPKYSSFFWVFGVNALPIYSIIFPSESKMIALDN